MDLFSGTFLFSFIQFLKIQAVFYYNNCLQGLHQTAFQSGSSWKFLLSAICTFSPYSMRITMLEKNITITMLEKNNFFQVKSLGILSHFIEHLIELFLHAWNTVVSNYTKSSKKNIFKVLVLCFSNVVSRCYLYMINLANLARDI